MVFLKEFFEKVDFEKIQQTTKKKKKKKKTHEKLPSRQKVNILVSFVLSFQPQHEISNNVVCAISKGSDQPAHRCSLIRAFAGRLNIL